MHIISFKNHIMDSTYKKFKEFIVSSRMFIDGDRILLSLSAGKDSMFLLHMMLNLANEIQLDLAIFHLNHMTRAEESNSDQKFIEEVAARLRLPIYSEKYNFTDIDTKRRSFEERARDVRYSFLEKISVKYDYNKIATAHNCDDNAETVLMRIFSGTGIYGLKGISYNRNNIYRPILSFSAKTIYEYLKENHILWREDSSNLCTDYQRNYIRNTLWPLIIQRFPNALKNINNLSSHANENIEMIESFINSSVGECSYFDGKRLIIDFEKFKEDITSFKFIFSRKLNEHFNFRLSISLFDEILRKNNSKKSNIILYDNSHIVIEKKYIHDKYVICVSKKNIQAIAPTHYEYRLFLGTKVSLYISEIKKNIIFERVEYSHFFKNEFRAVSNKVYLAIPENVSNIIVRNRRPGDRIRLESGDKKIKNLMIEKKLDSDTKEKIPLVIINGFVAAYLAGMIFAGNNRISSNFWVRKDTKKMIVIYLPQN